MAEWLKAPAWKACILLNVSRVRIPFSPPIAKIVLLSMPNPMAAIFFKFRFFFKNFFFMIP